MNDLLHQLLASDPAVVATRDVSTWWQRHQALAARYPSAIDRALGGGFTADCVAWAFASGYQAALEQLFGPDGPAALCATEKQGAHPRHIESELRREGDGFRLTGIKRFVTFGLGARVLYVVAARGEDDAGQKDLVVVRLAPGPGVVVEPLPPFPFVPEVPHAKLVIDAHVSEAAILPGDGYQRYLKPFRTVEDIHVVAALTGYLMAVARRAGLVHGAVEALASQAMTLRALAAASPSEPATHVALAGALARFNELAAALDLDALDEATRRGWLRDRSLLSVAASARERRLARAWELIAAASSS